MCIQGGTHEETPRPEMLVMDWTTGFLAKAGVGPGMVKIKFVKAKESELMYSETKFPGDVCPVDGGVTNFWDFLLSSSGRVHGVVVKYWREWACL